MYFNIEAYKKAFPPEKEVKPAPPQEETCEKYDEAEIETVTEAEEPALAEDAEESDDSPEVLEDPQEGAEDGRDS